MSTASPRILTALDERGVLTLSLNRPDKRNAMDLPLIEALQAALHQMDDERVRVVVIKGEGPGFSAGVDVATLAQVVAGKQHAVFRQVVASLQAMPNRLVALEKPVIAVLHNYVLGMGLELVLAADVRVAVAGTRFALPETRLGLIADVSGTTRLARLVGLSRAKQMHLFGREITAEEALTWGLVDEVVLSEDLEQAVERWIDGALRTAPLAAGLAKRIIERAQTDDPSVCLELERIAQTTLLGTKDLAEGLAAFMQKRAPRFRGK